MLTDAKANIILTSSNIKIPELFNISHQRINLDADREEISLRSSENLNIPIAGGDIAYIIFTSGSTGKPKGIAVSHQALANHQNWFLNTFALTNKDIVLQKTPFSFDASVWEFWTPLMVGGILVMAKPQGHQDPAYLVNTIKSQKVTLLQLVPSLLEMLLAEPGFSHCGSLRHVFSGGEALKTRVAKEFKQKLSIPLVNIYGPAETTIDVAYHICTEHENTDVIPIGKAVTNTKLYILNSHLQPVPMGTPGELFVAGLQLARGYWDLPGLTASKFLPDPFAENPGSRMYSTGDLARYLADGRIEFLGRVDRQVKIRGFRIETSEVVAALEKQDWIVRAATKVLVTAGKPNRLVAYLEFNQAPQNWLKVLRFQLSQILPNYMIPAFFVDIDNWPFLPNGKIDINALPLPVEENSVDFTEYVAPENEIEEILAQLWSEVLQISRVGVEDNFFELGGDSILCLQIIAKARDFGLYFTPQDLFKHPQITELAPQVKNKVSDGVVLPSLDKNNIPLSPIQSWFFQQELVHPEFWNQSILLDVKPEFNSEQIEIALNRIATIHPAFSLRFNQTDATWKQKLVEDGNNLNFDIVDLTKGRISELSNIGTKYQAQLNLTTGSLFQAVYFQTDENTPDKLLLIIHHLIVDGVSWRVILRDLSILLAGGSLSIPQNTSFPQWSNYLNKIAQDNQWNQDLDFWKTQTVDNNSLPNSFPNSFPLDFPEKLAENTENSAAQIECDLNPELTQILLYELPRTHKTRVQEVLLTVLLDVVTQWTKTSEITIALENHGRDSDFTNNLDISDTIGWFTSLFPCKLTKNSDDLLDNLSGVKTQLHNLPNNGFSYLILSQKT